MSSPAVIFITSSVPQPRGDSAAPPRALFGSPSSMDGWWSALAAHGLLDPASIFFACNAQYYKYFEYEAWGRGVPLANILNSGRSLGDSRVEWSTLRLAVRAAARGGARPALLLAADCAPAGGAAACGELVAALLRELAASGRSVALSRAGGAGGAGFSLEAGVAHPNLLALAAEDGALLAGPEGLAVLRAEAAAAAAAAAAGGAAATAPAAAGGEEVLPLELAAAALAARGRLSTAPAPGEGAFPLAGPPAAGEAPAPPGALPPPGPYAHALPPGCAPLAAAGGAYARGYARVGVLGNPSDGYHGKTLSVTVENFYAEAWVTPVEGAPAAAGGGAAVRLLPHPVFDPLRYPSLGHLATVCSREGYSGGLRLMAATLYRFHERARERGVALPPRPPLAARYHTTVPRQVGLAGSSAIITAFLRAVLAYFFGAAPPLEALGLTRDLLPNFVLAIEAEELGITAGLQDRVVQAYESAVHMDFSPPLLAERGHGAYTRIPVDALPPLFLAYAADPSDSGRIHAPIKQRWLAGDKEVRTPPPRASSKARGAKRVAQPPHPLPSRSTHSLYTSFR
jgi:hypothetical protein